MSDKEAPLGEVVELESGSELYQFTIIRNT